MPPAQTPSITRPGIVSINDINSLIGRASLRFGTTIVSGNMAWQPFATVSVFHEFIMAQTLVKITGIGVVNQGLWRLQTEYTLDYTGIAAASILVSAVPVLLFVILQRQFISGMTAGAMKG